MYFFTIFYKLNYLFFTNKRLKLFLIRQSKNGKVKAEVPSPTINLGKIWSYQYIPFVVYYEFQTCISTKIFILKSHSWLWWGQRPPRRRFKYPPNALKTDLKQIFMVPVWQIGPSIRSSTVPTWFYQFLQGTDCVLQTRCISKSKWIVYESDSIMEQ